MVDYYSNFIDVDRITKVTTIGVTRMLKIMFSRYGIPDQIISDNGPQFASSEFATFAKQWGFEHVTSSPRYPQSNGKAKNAVKTIKMLFSKCQDSGQLEYLTLLDWRNTPSEGMETSPAHVFLKGVVEHSCLLQNLYYVPVTLHKLMAGIYINKSLSNKFTIISIQRSYKIYTQETLYK